MSKKPGVMIYFDIMYAMRKLSYQEAGQLFMAIMEYAENQTQPELSEKLELVWSLIRPRLDTDDQAYYEKSAKARYSIYTRWERNAGRTPLPYEEWLLDTKLSRSDADITLTV